MIQPDPAEKLILIVDDEEMMRSFMEKTLAFEGYQVITVDDGRKALSMIREHKPHLILLDIKMPGEDGISVLQRIREESTVPIIMVTGLGGDDLIENTIDTGADDFVRKPFRPSELTARVKAKLRRVDNLSLPISELLQVFCLFFESMPRFSFMLSLNHKEAR